jgi:hypothetical protein
MMGMLEMNADTLELAQGIWSGGHYNGIYATNGLNGAARTQDAKFGNVVASQVTGAIVASIASVGGVSVSPLLLLPGYREFMALLPQKLILPPRTSGITHVLYDASTILTMRDLSPNASHLTGSAPATLPTISSVGGLATAHFAATQALTGNTPNGMNGGTAWSLLIACTCPATGNGKYIVGSTHDDAYGYAVTYTTGVLSFAFDGQLISFTPGDTALHSYLLVCSASAKLRLYVDGALTYTESSAATGSTIHDPGATELLGTSHTGQYGATADVALFAHFDYSMYASLPTLRACQAATRIALAI